MPFTRTAAIAAVTALALGATACASRRTTSDTQTTTPAPVTAASPAATSPLEEPGSRPTDAGVAARTLPSDQPSVNPGASFTATTPGGAPLALADIFFSFDESTLSDDARQTLDRNAEFLRRNTGSRVQIEGHADERGSTAYNLALGDRRAAAAKRYLESLGIDPTRVSTISFGEEKPFAAGASEDAWAQNRRGHFVVVR